MTANTTGKKSIRTWGVVVLFIALVLGFFYKTVIYRQLPVPSDTLVGLYHPWRDLYAAEYPRGVPFKNFLITDPIRQQIPWRKVVIDAWLAGDVPSLNPYSFAGVPLDANIQAAPFYPFNLLFLVFSFPVSWTILIVLQPLLSGIFFYLFVKKQHVSDAAAIVGAVVWAFSGFGVSWLTWGTIVHVSMWLPLLLLSVDELYHAKKSIRHYLLWTALLSTATVMTLLAGHIQVALYVYATAIGYVVWKYSITKHALPLRWLILSGVISVVVSAPQWVPLLRFIYDTGRIAAAESWKTVGWFLPWQHLVQFIAPDFFGNPATLNYWGVWNYGEFIGYIGVIPLIFALSGMATPGLPRFFAYVAGISLLCMLPNPLSKFIYVVHTPVLSVMQPTRLMVLVDFSLAILAAYSLDRWIKGEKILIKMSSIVVGVIVATLWIIVLGGRFIITSSEVLANLEIAKRNLIIPTILFLACIGGMGVYRVLHQKLYKSLWVGALLVVIVADLFRFGWKFTPFTSEKYFFPETQVITFLQKQPKPFRVMSLDDRILPPNVSAYYGIETIEGYDPLAPKRYEELLAASERGNADTNTPSGFNRIYTAHNIDSSVLPYMNVRYVLALGEVKRPFLREVMKEGETFVYEYTRELPRVYLADYVEVKPEKETLASLFASHVSYRGIHDGSVNILNTVLTGDESAEIISYAPNVMTVRVNAENKRLLVILNRYDKRWKAEIRGAAMTIVPVNYLFMGVAVPSGNHDIILTYR
jgi:hypothetical protein